MLKNDENGQESAKHTNNTKQKKKRKHERTFCKMNF